MARLRHSALRRPWPLRIRLTLAFSLGDRRRAGRNGRDDPHRVRPRPRQTDRRRARRSRALAAGARDPRVAARPTARALGGGARADLRSRREGPGVDSAGERHSAAGSRAGAGGVAPADPHRRPSDRRRRRRRARARASRWPAVAGSRRSPSTGASASARCTGSRCLLAIALPGALLLASLAGYQVARRRAAPVERMRARAAGDRRRATSASGCRSPAPATSSTGSRRRSTSCSTGCSARSSASGASSATPATSCARRSAVLRTRLDVALRGEQRRPTRCAQRSRARTAMAARLSPSRRRSARARPRRPGAAAVAPRAARRAGPARGGGRRHARAAADRRTVARRGQRRIDGGAVVLADADRVAQALDNLVVNALRYGAGTIELARGELTPRPVVIEVADRGPGYPDGFFAARIRALQPGRQLARERGQRARAGDRRGDRSRPRRARRLSPTAPAAARSRRSRCRVPEGACQAERSRYPAPRTVSSVSTPKGRSIFSRR